jgi:hypothetical protein
MYTYIFASAIAIIILVSPFFLTSWGFAKVLTK